MTTLDDVTKRPFQRVAKLRLTVDRGLAGWP